MSDHRAERAAGRRWADAGPGTGPGAGARAQPGTPPDPGTGAVPADVPAGTGEGAGASGASAYSVVIPTLGRTTLHECLGALAASSGPPPERILLVDDRPWSTAQPPPELDTGALGDELRARTTVVPTGGLGPAAARNSGWRRVSSPWTVFLDDDVRVSRDWRERLAADLSAAPGSAGAVQGVIEVPLPRNRPLTDWERGTAGLAEALWITADMAYRTEALRHTGGFDERFTRAFREDSDLALRVLDSGWSIRRGARRTEHPVRAASRWASLRSQRGNADDALMAAVHGPYWRTRAAAPRGRIRRHTAITAAGCTGLLLAASGHRRAGGLALSVWAAGTAEFSWARIAPGPRDRRETLTMLATSALIPPAAVWHRIRGELRCGAPTLRNALAARRQAPADDDAFDGPPPPTTEGPPP